MKPFIRIELNAYSEDSNNGLTAPVVKIDYENKDVSGDFIEKRSELELSEVNPQFRKGLKAIFYHLDFDPRFVNAPYICMEGELDYKENFGWFAKNLKNEKHLKHLVDYSIK